MKRVRPSGEPSRAHLQQRQFFHVAPESERQNIESHGIDFRLGQRKWETNQSGEGNFLWTQPSAARRYQHMARQLSHSDDTMNWLDYSGQNYDVYEVTMPTIQRPPLEDDPEFGYGEAVRTTSPIPRRFIRRIG